MAIDHRRSTNALDFACGHGSDACGARRAGLDGLSAPRRRRRDAALAAAVLCARGADNVGFRPGPRTDVLRAPDARPGAVRLADAVAGLRWPARAGALLDDGGH